MFKNKPTFSPTLSLKAGANGSNMLDTTCWMLDATCWNRLFAYFLFINFFLFGTRKFDFFFIINTLLASFFLCKMDEHEVVNVDEVESRKKRKIARKWSDEEVEELIDLYEEKSILWDLFDKDAIINAI